MAKPIMLIDGSNVFHGARGLGRTMDYAKVRKYVSTLAGLPEGSYLDAVYYTPLDKDNTSQNKFTNWLLSNGYRLMSVPVIHREGDKGSGRVHTIGVDTTLATDIYRYHSKGYKIYLLSGNSIYTYPVEQVQREGGEVQVLGFNATTSGSLRKASMGFTSMDHLDLFFDAPRPVSNKPPKVHDQGFKPIRPIPMAAQPKDHWRDLDEEDVIVVNGGINA